MSDASHRLAIHCDSPFHNADLLVRGIGIRFKGVEKHNVEEYCISEGWIRVQAGKELCSTARASR